MRTKLLITAAAGLALTATSLTALHASAQDDAAPQETPDAIDWAPCDGDETAECGVLDVPVDWEEPDGETVGVSVVRRAATNPEERIGSLVVNYGGPGDPSGGIMEYMGSHLSPELGERFDLIGFDARGVAFSEAIHCSPELLESMPSPFFENQDDFDERLDYNDELRADCREHNGALYDNVDTLSVVRDLDAIREALGEEQLSYYGTSYGTFIGQQYAEEYPERVRAFALDANVDHSIADAESWLEDKAEMFQGAFDQFVSWCESDERCALNGNDVRETWGDVLDRADRGEIPHPEDPGATLDSHSIIDEAFQCSYGPQWSELAGLVADLDAGAPTDLTPCRTMDDPPVEIEDPQALSIANFCEDYSLPIEDYDQWEHLVREAGREHAPDVRYSPNAVGRIAHCLGNEHVPNPQHELEVDGSAPILLTNPLYDPITGHNSALAVAEQIGEEAHLLTYEGAGHGAYGTWSGSECVTEITDEYLLDLTLPDDPAACPAVPYEPPA